MKNLPNRKQIRLKKYDYSLPGWYYVTICTQNRENLFGDIGNQKMIINDAGKMIDKWYLKIPDRFKNVTLDTYRIMPNHLHGIIVINGQTHGFASCGQTHGFAPTGVNPNRIANPVVGADPCVGPRMTMPDPCVGPRMTMPDPCVGPRMTMPDPCVGRRNQTLFKTIRWFKTMATNQYIRNVKNNEWKPFNKHLFQRNYYEHIIRNETELAKIRRYIKSNPEIWERDRNKNQFSNHQTKNLALRKFLITN